MIKSALLLPAFALILAACGGQPSAQSSSSSVSSQSSSTLSSMAPPSSSSISSQSPAAVREAWLEAFGPAVNPAVIENGVTLYDEQGDILHAHGAGMIQVGEFYYWYGENRYSDQSFRSVRMYRSKDLKHWTFVNDVLKDSSDADLDFAKIERPKIIYNQATRRYVMWMHKEGGDNYGQARAAVASSPTVDGNYTYHGSFRPLNHMSRDATAFVDDDGAAYFLSAANENADLHLYRLTDDYTDIAYLVQKIWVGQHREAPAIIKRNGYYFLLTSGTSGWDPNQARYGYSTSLGGNWSTPQNIGNGTTFDSQPTFVLVIEGSTTTSYLYMGDRWLDPKYEDSKYVWLPLEFSGDTSISMNWSTRVALDLESGLLLGSGVEEVRLQSKHSAKCLDVSDANLAEHANVLQWTCNNAHNQKWRFTEAEPGFYQLKALHSSQCLDVASASVEDGANVLQWPCNQSANQLWQKSTVDGDYFTLRSKASGKCLDVAKWSSDDGGNIQQWECTERENQFWRAN